MQDIWFTGEVQNQFVLYIGGLFGLLYLVSLLVGYAQRRCEPVTVAITTPDEHKIVYEYIIVVKTSVLSYSQCASSTKVYVQLQGQIHNSPWFTLPRGPTRREILQRGGIDIFVVHTSENLGDIDLIRLKLENDLPGKYKWTPSGFEIYEPCSQTVWLSEAVPKLQWQKDLGIDVFLRPKDSKNRCSPRPDLRGVLTGHIWLSVTQGGTRFGAFTSLCNLLLFYCSLSLILSANIVCLLFAENNSTEFDLNIEKIHLCLAATSIVALISWLLEAFARNLRPYTKLNRNFKFKGLNELRRESVQDNVSEKGDTKTIDEMVDSKTTKEAQKTKANIEGHARRNVDSESEFNSLTVLTSFNHNQIGSCNDIEMSESETHQRLSRRNETTTSLKSSQSENSGRKYISSLGERPSLSDSLKRKFSWTKRKLPFPSFLKLKRFRKETERRGKLFQEPFELASKLAKDMLSQFQCAFSDANIENNWVKDQILRMHGCMSQSIINLFTQQAGMRYSTFEKLREGKTTPNPLEYSVVVEGMVNSESNTVLECNDPSQVVTIMAEHISPENEEEVKHTQMFDNVLYEDGDTISEESKAAVSDIENGFQCIVSSSPYEGDSTSTEPLEPMECSCKKSDCAFCRIVTVGEDLSYMLIRNGSNYFHEMSLNEGLDLVAEGERDEMLVKGLEDMAKEFLCAMHTVVQDNRTIIQITKDSLVDQSVAAIVHLHKLKEAHVQMKRNEELCHIQNRAKDFIQSLVEEAASEIREELILEDAVRKVCSSAVEAAIEDVWNQLNDPIFVFAEYLLKETVVDIVKHECGLNKEEGKESNKDENVDKDAEEETGESESKSNIGSPDPVYEEIYTAITSWEQKLDELSASPESLLTLSLIKKFEHAEDVNISQLTKTLNEYYEVQMKVQHVCVNRAKRTMSRVIHHIYTGLSSMDRELWSFTAVRERLNIHLVNVLEMYVHKVKVQAQITLAEAVHRFRNTTLVKQEQHSEEPTFEVIQPEDQTVQLKTCEDLPTINVSDIKELKEDLYPMRRYLKFVQRDVKRTNAKNLADHIRGLERKRKEYVLVNLQTFLDSHCMVDDLPREFSERELYACEWFISGDLNKVLPARLKPMLVLLMLTMTVFCLVYFVMKGAELTTVQTQEWACLALISCAFYALVFEPLKVCFMMCMEQRINRHPGYS